MSSQSGSSGDDPRPNIVLLTAHDCGRYFGCYGRQPHTPNLDEVAADGALFEEFFCTTPHCAPSRASVETGLHPHNHGMMGHPVRDTDTATPRRNPSKGWEIDEGIRTLPMYLNERGYDTHLAVYQHASGIAENVGYGTIHDNIEKRGHTGDSAPSGARAVADVTERILHEEIDEQRPFYVEAATDNAHSPYSRREGGFKDDPIPGYEGPGPEEIDLPPHVPDPDDLDGFEADEMRRQFADQFEDLYELDHAVGRILHTLEETGHREDTVFVFTTDHGTDVVPKAKGTCYDPGIEAALLLQWPGRIDGGKRYDHLASGVDILPTLLDCVDGNPPVDVDGESLRPLIDSADDRSYGPREAVFFEKNWFGSYDPIRGIRTREHKLLRNFWPGSHSNAPRNDEDEVELYDLGVDPHETENVASEADYAELRVDLYDRLGERLRDDGDPVVDGPIPPRPGLFDVTL